MLDRNEEYDRMAQCEEQLWWYRALHERTVESIRRAAGNRSLRVLDAGCGTGGLMLFLQAQGLGAVEGFDLSESAVAYCLGRGLNVQQLDLRQMTHHYAGRQFDVIVSNDTICYLSTVEREDFLSGARTLLSEGGLLIFNAPAFDAFGGIHDHAVGIGKRFRREDIRGMHAMDGWTEIASGYWPFLLSPLIYLVRRGQRAQLAGGQVTTIRSDVSLPAPWLNRFLLALCRLERRWLGFGPWASSLFMVLRRS